MVFEPDFTASHASPAHVPMALNPASTVLPIVPAPDFTASHASPAHAPTVLNPASTVLPIVPPVFFNQSQTSEAHSAAFLTNETTAVTARDLMVSHPSLTFLIAVSPISLKLSQFAATVDARPAAPASIKPKPIGILPATIARMPSTRDAPLIIPVITPIGPRNLSVITFQLAVTVAARPTAPAAIMPRPRGIAAPLNVKTAPSASNAPLTIEVIVATLPVNLSFNQSQLNVAAAPVTPAASNPTPIGTFAPEKVRIAPSAIDAALIAPTTPFADAETLPVIKSQFRPTAAARLAAPAAIIAIPSPR